MSTQIKDTDYLYVSAFLWASESSMLNTERIARIFESKDFEEATKVLEECGYNIPANASVSEIESELSAKRARVMSDLSKITPNKAVVDIFRIKYDYHNAKVLVKAEGIGKDGSKLISEAGRVSPKSLTDAFIHGEYTAIPTVLANSIQEAKEILAKTKDPQLADFVLDRAYYNEFLRLAKESGSQTLVDYGVFMIDSANLRSTIRSIRMKKDPAFLQQILVDNGSVYVERIINAVITKSSLAQLYAGTSLVEAAKMGDSIAAEGRLTNFEKVCDNALVAYVNEIKEASFSDRVLIAYICMLENEISAVRVIMTGLLAGLSQNEIKERLRDSYV